MANNLLIIRFSSFGDIVQALKVPASVKASQPKTKITWLSKSQFSGLMDKNPHIDQVLHLENFTSLYALARFLHQQKFTHIYDAHNNLRSKLLIFMLRIFGLFRKYKILTRKKHRLKRLLLFKFHKNLLPKPFVGQNSYLKPLEKWHISAVKNTLEFYIDKNAVEYTKVFTKEEKKNIAIVASAAWPLKRWPIHYWQEFFDLVKDKDWHWILLGGPEDTFLEDLKNKAPLKSIVNLAGKLTLDQSNALLSQCDYVIANDTGLIHVADQLNIPGIIFIGPSAFGYTLSKGIRALEAELYCKPCSKDGSAKCINKIEQKCMLLIKPQKVFETICKDLA